MSYRQAFSSFYGRNFERRPWITLAVTNGILGVLADGAAQSLERISAAQSRQQAAESSDPASGKVTATVSQVTEQGPWDWSRSGRFLAFNVGMAPFLAEWNKFLEFRFPLRTPTAAAAGAAAGAAGTLGKVSLRALGNRVAMDQMVL